MITTWEEFRGHIREGILREIDTGDLTLEWSDAELLMYCHWALNDLCAHTAYEATFIASSTEEDPETEAPYEMAEKKNFAISPAPFTNLFTTAFVTVEHIGQIYEVKPARNPIPVPGEYTTWGQNVLELGAAPGAGSILKVRYYGYYPLPEGDTDIIPSPQWAQSALAFKIGAYAVAGRGLRSANIRQWDDQGNRIQNPLLETQKWFLSVYESVLGSKTPQNRTRAMGTS
jgi:hypothetical protein